MDLKLVKSCTAFADSKKIASGKLKEVARDVKKYLQKEENKPPSAKTTLLIFDDSSGEQIEIDFRGTSDAVLGRLGTDEPPPEVEKKIGPGRPKLGVIAREVTLLPHHWDWLAAQTGGASVTLRKLVEEAKKKSSTKDRIRRAQDASYKFMTVIAGDRPGFEEALRALYAKDQVGFHKWVKPWPKDIRDHLSHLTIPVFGD